MRSVFTVIARTCLLSALCTTAAAECIKPAAPALPDPDQAVTPEMVKANNEVRAFMANADAYLKCINDAAMHNQMVEEMEAVAAHFNDIIRKYKARINQ